MHYMISAGKIC